MEQYSASAEDLPTVCCFLDFQDIIESPRNMQYPVIDLLVSGQDAQSESAKPLRWSSNLLENNNPCPRAPFRYYKILLAACRWGFLGLDINWLNLWTAMVISGLAIIRYSNLPTSQNLDFSTLSLKLAQFQVFFHRDLSCGLHPNRPASINSSRVYFLWQKWMPNSDLAIIISLYLYGRIWLGGCSLKNLRKSAKCCISISGGFLRMFKDSKLKASCANERWEAWVIRKGKVV